MEFGEAVKARRTCLEMTQGDLSERSGISKAMLSEIESGKKNPTLKVACSIAMGLDCQISDLLDVPRSARLAKLDGEQRRVLVDPQSGVERHLLSPPMVAHGVQVLLFIFPPGQRVEFNPDGAGVVEHATCVTGRLRVERDNHGELESVELGSGESANYAADAPTTLINTLEGQETRAFVVIDASRRGEPLVFE
ncbi:MAG: helix-turn-helix domain-containing protein [Phycisphaerales bacterium JB059]